MPGPDSIAKGRELQRRLMSFRYALSGCWYVLRTQRNAWIHMTISVVVVAGGLWLRLPRGDWALIILAMMIVWIAEFINTSIEAIVDMTMPQVHPLAKIAKDVAAGAVFIGACAAALIGILVLGPPLFERFVVG